MWRCQKYIIILATSALLVLASTLALQDRQKCAFDYSHLQPTRATKIYLTSIDRVDGMGTTYALFLFSAAFARWWGWVYTGIKEHHTSHSVDSRAIFDFLFQDSAIVMAKTSNCFPSQSKSVHVFRIDSVRALKDFAIRNNGTSFLAPTVSGTKANNSNLLVYDAVLVHLQASLALKADVKYLTPEIIRQFQELAKPGITKVLADPNRNFFPTRTPTTTTTINTAKDNDMVLTVAVHIRRGDVPEAKSKGGYFWVDTGWYVTMVKAIKQLYPYASIHIFSVLCTRCNAAQQAVDFEEFTAMGCAVHMRNEASRNATNEWMEDFAHLASAQILVLGHSLLSHAAAYLNPNCIVHGFNYEKHFYHSKPDINLHSAMPSWIDLHHARKNQSILHKLLDQQLVPCVRGLQQPPNRIWL